MKSVRSVIAVCVASVLATGCASIVGKSDYVVALNTQPAGAEFTVTNKSGATVHSGSTPASVALKSGSGYFSAEEYTVSFKKDGLPERTTTIRSSLSGWYFGNILIGGVIGMLIVDPITGAMWTLEENVNLDLEKDVRTDRTQTAEKSAEDKSAANTTAPTLNIVTLDQVPAEYRQHLVRVAL